MRSTAAAKKQAEEAAAKKKAEDERVAAEKAKLMEAYQDKLKAADSHVSLYLGTSRRLEPDGQTGDFAKIRDWSNATMVGYQVRDIGNDWKNGAGQCVWGHGA